MEFEGYIRDPRAHGLGQEGSVDSLASSNFQTNQSVAQAALLSPAPMIVECVPTSTSASLGKCNSENHGGGGGAAADDDGVGKYTPRSTSVVFNSKKIDIVFNEYDDRYFVIITQMNKIGTLVEASAEDSILREGALTYTTSTLIGKRDDMLIDVYARHILDILHR